MTQISEVERGGATVFPEFGLRIPPSKVTPLFLYFYTKRKAYVAVTGRRRTFFI